MPMKMRILVFEPGKKPEVQTIDHTLAAMQDVVKGDASYGVIAHIFPWDDPIALVCHDKGKVLNMMPNRVLQDENGNVYDVVFGPCFICGVNPDDNNFSSIPYRFIERFMDEKECFKLFPAVENFLEFMISNLT